MVDSFRKSLIGLLCLSMVGCGSMSDGDAAATGMVVVGLGALAALILLVIVMMTKGTKAMAAEIAIKVAMVKETDMVRGMAKAIQGVVSHL